MKALLLTFDLEEFVANELGLEVEREVCFEISKKGFGRLLRMLRNQDTKATFFTTLEFAEFCPELIDQALQEGHELGLHALRHKDRYSRMPDEKALSILREAKQKLEKRFNIKIVSFRAPQMSRPSYAVLKKLGIEIDSSYHPTWVPGHYNLFFRTRSVHKADSITVVPVSVTPFLRLPFSWIWFRTFPLAYSKLCALTYDPPLNFYFHPWEFEDVSSYKVFKPIVWKTGESFLGKLGRYIKWCHRQGYRSKTMQEFVHGR